jgi:hypothetical protein
MSKVSKDGIFKGAKRGLKGQKRIVDRILETNKVAPKRRAIIETHEAKRKRAKFI